MSERFVDSGETVHAFTDETLVACPRCAGCAVSRQLDPLAARGWFTPRRLTCTHCGYTDCWESRSIARGWYHARDDYFELPLWLQTSCCGETLWAYNEQHLEFIEAFVGAKVRVRSPGAAADGWSNRSLASRLPGWLKSARNRDAVLKATGRLRSKLPPGN